MKDITFTTQHQIGFIHFIRVNDDREYTRQIATMRVIRDAHVKTTYEVSLWSPTGWNRFHTFRDQASAEDAARTVWTILHN